MCESNVYVREGEDERLIMEDAVLLENDDGRIKVVDILGDQKELEGEVEEITFLDHRIIIRPKAEG